MGRGLTLKGLVSSYFARRPGDHSVGMQLQRWCGYRYVPGEDTLDLARVTMPMSLANGFNQMLSVELANRHSLDTYRREGVRPIEVGFRLQQTPGYPLVSEAKRGRMKVTMNPYSGREKSQTNHSLSTAELNQHTENWEIYRRFFETWSEGGGPASKDTDFLGQGLDFGSISANIEN